MGSLSRRRFLKGAAAAAGSAIAFPTIVSASALGKDGAVPPSDRVALGYIGLGPRGMMDLREQMGVSGAQLVAVCDVWKNRRDRAKQMVDQHYRNADCKAYVDFRDLLARPDIDAVGIASPDHWHVPMTILAAQAGKDVSCEKPLGISVAEDLACRDVIKRHARVFQYGTEARSNPRRREACEIVRSGALGTIREVHVFAPNSNPGGSLAPKPVPSDLDYDLWLGPAPWRPYSGCPNGGDGWFHVRDYALGFIAGWAAHPLDLMVWAYDIHKTGPWEVEGTGKIDTRGCNDAVYDWDVRFALANGVRMTLRTNGSPGAAPHSCCSRLNSDYVLFVGERGWIAFGYYCNAQADPPELLREPRNVRLTESRGQEDNFIQCVRTRRTPVSPIDDAVNSDLISQVADIAIRSGRKIKWDPLKGEVIGDAEAARLCNRATRAPWRA
jgi:predicted dehydrogenase